MAKTITLLELLRAATSPPISARPTGMILNDTGNVEFVAQIICHGPNVGTLVQMTDRDKANALLLSHCRNNFVEMRNLLVQVRTFMEHHMKQGLLDSTRAEMQGYVDDINKQLTEIDTIKIPEGF